MYKEGYMLALRQWLGIARAREHQTVISREPSFPLAFVCVMIKPVGP
jgi:hypothetical protein